MLRISSKTNSFLFLGMYFTWFIWLAKCNREGPRDSCNTVPNSIDYVHASFKIVADSIKSVAWN